MSGNDDDKAEIARTDKVRPNGRSEMGEFLGYGWLPIAYRAYQKISQGNTYEENPHVPPVRVVRRKVTSCRILFACCPQYEDAEKLKYAGTPRDLK